MAGPPSGAEPPPPPTPGPSWHATSTSAVPAAFSLLPPGAAAAATATATAAVAATVATAAAAAAAALGPPFDAAVCLGACIPFRACRTAYSTAVAFASRLHATRHEPSRDATGPTTSEVEAAPPPPPPPAPQLSEIEVADAARLLPRFKCTPAYVCNGRMPHTPETTVVLKSSVEYTARNAPRTCSGWMNTPPEGKYRRTATSTCVAPAATTETLPLLLPVAAHFNLCASTNSARTTLSSTRGDSTSPAAVLFIPAVEAGEFTPAVEWHRPAATEDESLTKLKLSADGPGCSAAEPCRPKLKLDASRCEPPPPLLHSYFNHADMRMTDFFSMCRCCCCEDAAAAVAAAAVGGVAAAAAAATLLLKESGCAQVEVRGSLALAAD